MSMRQLLNHWTGTPPLNDVFDEPEYGFTSLERNHWFCEHMMRSTSENPQAHEYVNAFTALAMILMVFSGWFNTTNNSSTMKIVYALIICNAITSFANHWTLEFGWSFMDGITMVIAVCLGNFLLYSDLAFSGLVFRGEYFWYRFTDSAISLITMFFMCIALTFYAIPSLRAYSDSLFGIAIGTLIPGLVYLILYFKGLFQFIIVKVPDPNQRTPRATHSESNKVKRLSLTRRLSLSLGLAAVGEGEADNLPDADKNADAFLEEMDHTTEHPTINIKIRLESLKTIVEDLRANGIQEHHIKRIVNEPFLSYLVCSKSKAERKIVGTYLIIALTFAILSALFQLIPENLCRRDPDYWPKYFGWYTHGLWHLGMSWSLSTIGQCIQYYHMLDNQVVPTINDRFTFSLIDFHRPRNLYERFYWTIFFTVVSKDTTRVFDLFNFTSQSDVVSLRAELKKQKTQVDSLATELRKTKEEMSNSGYNYSQSNVAYPTNVDNTNNSNNTNDKPKDEIALEVVHHHH